MLRPPDSSQSARLQGGNARRRGPFEKKIWVNATVQGLEDVQNDVFLSALAASTFYRICDVRGGWAQHGFRSCGEFPDASWLQNGSEAGTFLFISLRLCTPARSVSVTDPARLSHNYFNFLKILHSVFAGWRSTTQQTTTAQRVRAGQEFEGEEKINIQ